MTQDSSFDDLMARLRAGDDAAAAEVFRRFAHRLIGLARSRLGGQLRQRVDPEDVMQSVFRSFFRRHAEGALTLESWDRLWSLLAVITLRKCGHRADYYRAACRDIGREVALTPATPEGSAAEDFEAIAREPTPGEVAMLTETVELLMRGLDARDRQIVQMALQGETVPDISAAVNYSERTVERVLKRVRERLERMRAEGAAKD
jgi:RNA polymerase sigma-70 factor (ECF subfamily)